jgi:hypothetical protein
VTIKTVNGVDISYPANASYIRVLVIGGSKYSSDGYDIDGYNKNGFDPFGYRKNGLNKAGYDREGYNKHGFNRAGFDRSGYDKHGFTQKGYDREGYDSSGYNSKGVNRSGLSREYVRKHSVAITKRRIWLTVGLACIPVVGWLMIPVIWLGYFDQ